MGDYRPSHVGLCVRDLERSLRFFCDGLGFERAEGFELDSTAAEGLERSLEVAGPVRIMSQFIQNDTMKIELLHFFEPGVGGVPSATRNQLGLTHLSFYVDDLDAAVAHLRHRSVQVLGDPMPLPGPEAGEQARFVFALTPWGLALEFVSYPHGKAWHHHPERFS